MSTPPLCYLLALMALFGACAKAHHTDTLPGSQTFAIAVIPDTQNYLDYQHQRQEGFAIDGKAMFIEQMQDIVLREDVVFVASVGDVWQHSSKLIDPEHALRGVGRMENPYLEQLADLRPTPETLRTEIPGAIEGYRLLKEAGIPFGVAPGNHDYDAFWSVEGFEVNTEKEPEDREIQELDWGMIHVGGLDNFRSVFGAQSEFFEGKPWYVSDFRGGANAAQVFEAAGYRFLHITFEMSPGDAVLDWARGVLAAHPGYPTIVTTHEYIDAHGRRKAIPAMDLARADPKDNNNPEQLWEKFLSQHDQIFLVLCGHHYGQSHRVDLNKNGKKVYQVLADYQARRQAVIDAGNGVDPNPERAVGLGDGWYRLMRFDMSVHPPTLQVQTWSSHYRHHASEMDSYADWYRDTEQPGMSGSDFVAADEFVLFLDDFEQRFD